MGKSLRMVHASGNTFMNLGKLGADLGSFFEMGTLPLWVTVTEAGEPETIRMISSLIRKSMAPYNVVNPDRGDIAFLLHHDARLKNAHGSLAIPADHRPASEGGHGPRFNSTMWIQWRDENINVDGCHLVTYHDGKETRADQQVEQMTYMGHIMQKQAQGRALAIGSGDLNGKLPTRADLQKVFDDFGMTTTAEEAGVWTGTHDGGARIDYVWTMDRDKRVSVENMRVLTHGFNSDHHPVVVDLHIRD